MSIATNIKSIKAELQETATLVAVSKTKPIEAILDVYNTGHKIFGENKVQEMVGKQAQLPADIEWHLIGHLQNNKVKYIAPFVKLIHSVDSIKLLKEIDKQAKNNERVIDCLLQIHIAVEETKFGFSVDEVSALFKEVTFEKLANINIVGLMGMASFTNDEGQVRAEFKGLNRFYEQLKTSIKDKNPKNINLKVLSMGMSGDYKIALEEGSTMVRIGSSIFGTREHSFAN